MSHSESGGLSTVMKLPGSSEPKNHAFQLSLAGAWRRRRSTSFE